MRQVTLLLLLFTAVLIELMLIGSVRAVSDFDERVDAKTTVTLGTSGDFTFQTGDHSWLTGQFKFEDLSSSSESCSTDTVDKCLLWPDQAVLTIYPATELSSEQVSCETVHLQSLNLNYIPEVCFDIGQSLWYGVAELHTQRWPLNDVTLPMQPFVTNDLVPNNSSYGNVIGRYWLSSSGVAITVDEDSPLHASFNEGSSNQICFRAEFKPPFLNNRQRKPHLGAVVCKGRDVRVTHDFVSSKIHPVPSGLPDSRMFKSPVWSTWARYKVDIDQSKVLQYADEIVSNGFSNSQIEIDDMFSTNYGEFDFTPDKFSDPAKMVRQLKEKGFRVTVWVTPFANYDSPAFKDGMEHSFWLEDPRQEVPSLVKWWQGTGATLDVSNPRAVDWYLARLERMKQEYYVNSFKFDAGEVTYLPASYMPLDPWDNPCQYTKLYVEAVSKMGSMIEVRCGYNSQHVPVFVRMGDKESRWNYDNGLKTIIPTALTFGILGYPYILPDMIGGNGYGEETDENPFTQIILPDRELYIRWLQVTSYLPAMQFSFVPWQYDPEVVAIAREYVRVHEEVVTPLLLAAARETQTSGAPLIRPLWWIAPTDEFALSSDSEFLVGSRLLVAPVLERGARQRDIYLPEGNWEDQLRGVGVKGPVWLKNYKVDLTQVPTFERR